MTRRLDLAACAAAGAAIAIGQTVARGRIDLGSPFRATIAVTLGVAALAFAVSIIEQSLAGLAARADVVYYLRDWGGLLLRVGITDDWPARIAHYLDGSDDDSQPGLSARVNPAESNPIRPCWTRGQAIRIERRRIRAISASMHRRHPLAPQTLANDQHFLDAQEWAELAPHKRAWLRFWGLAYRAESLVGPDHSWRRPAAPQAARQAPPHQPPTGHAERAVEDATDAYSAMPAESATAAGTPTRRPEPPSAPILVADTDEPGPAPCEVGDGQWITVDADGQFWIGAVPEPPQPSVPPAPFYYVEGSVPAQPIQVPPNPEQADSETGDDQDCSASDGPVPAGGTADDEQTVVVPARIAALLASGMTVRAIAVELSMSPSAVQRVIKRYGLR